MNDAQLYGHATTAPGITVNGTTAVNGPTLDFSSNSRVQTMLATLRVQGPLIGSTGGLVVKVQEIASGTTWADYGLAFANATDTDYGSGLTGGGGTYAAAPQRLAIRVRHRYLRFVFTPTGATAGTGGVSVTLEPYPDDPGAEATKNN